MTANNGTLILPLDICFIFRYYALRNNPWELQASWKLSHDGAAVQQHIERASEGRKLWQAAAAQLVVFAEWVKLENPLSAAAEEPLFFLLVSSQVLRTGRTSAHAALFSMLAYYWQLWPPPLDSRN